MKKLFSILTLFWIFFVVAQEKIVYLTDTTSTVTLNPFAEFILAKKGKIPDFQKKEDLVSFRELNKINEFSPEIKAVFAKVTVENKSSTKEFFVNIQDHVPHLQVYQLSESGMKFLGETGFILSQKFLSVKKDPRNVNLKFLPGERKVLVFKIDSFRNELFFNTLYLISEKKYLQEGRLRQESLIYDRSPLILFFVGIHFCLAVLAISRLRTKFFRISIFIFIVINIFYIIFYSADHDYIDLENSLFPGISNNDYIHFLGAIEPALYYVFFWSYLDKNRIFRRVVLYSGFFWVAFYFITNIEWNSLFMVEVSRFLRVFGPVYDLIITAAVFAFLLRYKSTFHRFARLGVFILLLSAIQLSLPFIFGLLGIQAKSPRFIDENSYFIMYTAIILDFMLFLYGQNKNDLQIQTEKENYQKQFLLNEVNRQKLILEERRRISHDMHDGLGAGISAIKLQAEFLRKKTTDKNLQEDIDDLLETSEDMNLSMREILWNLNSKNDNVGNFVQYASNYTENFFRKTDFKTKIITLIADEKTPLSDTSRRNLFLCFKEALNNIYKHSKAKNVHVVFQQTEGFFSIDIEDDGKGIGKEDYEGNGMKNMRQRMQDCNGEFRITQTETGVALKFFVRFLQDFKIIDRGETI